MFFAASKIFWGVVAPSHIVLWLVLAGAAALATGRQQAGRMLVLAAAGLFILIGVLPTGRWLLRPIESEYHRPNPPPAHVDGILTLGGEPSAPRLAGTYELAQRYPQARIVFSGGSGELIDNRPGVDAREAKDFLLALGLDPKRLTLEGRSRNTWENLLFTRQLVHPKEGEIWVLATSAVQIPRAMDIAHRLDWTLVPWPTDWQSGDQGETGYFQIGPNLSGFDHAVREIIGRLAYRLSGRAADVSPH